jgi:hypothetical protein
MHRGQEAGPAAPLGRPHLPNLAKRAIGPRSLKGTQLRAILIEGVKSVQIQRTRLDSLGSMDPQTSDQPTLGNNQHFIYTKENAPECMTRGPMAGRNRRSGRTSFLQQTNPQRPSNHLRDQIIDARSKAVKIIGPAAPRDTTAPPCQPLQLPLAYKYPFLQPPTYWGCKLSRTPRRRTKVIISKWWSPLEVSI